MKAIPFVTACLCVALLPSITACESDDSEESPYREYLDKLNGMAERGRMINRVFKLSENGHLGSGTYGFAYKGTLQISSSERVMVAMKFTLEHSRAEREYRMYTYLEAINNTNVEAYGIPSVYYYGNWTNFHLMATTLLDTECYKMYGPSGINQIDVLIVFREFVRITKYIHSRGVRHDDIKLDNIMFRQQAFIIDYNSALKMYSVSDSFLSMEEREDGKRGAKGDWASFLTVMCSFLSIKFDFAILGSDSSVGLFNENDLRWNIIDTMKTFERIEHDGLRRVFVEFAKHAFEDAIKHSGDIKSKYEISESIPCYDHLYEIITEEIAKYGLEEPFIVSWITDQDREEAVKNLRDHPIPKISTINDPFGMVELKYPDVNFDYFSENLSSAKTSEASSSRKKSKHRKS